MNREVKQESSIPVQYRVSIVTLADLAKYWKRQGEHIRTISQLSAWSMYLLSEILRSNNLLEPEMGVAEARNYMMQEGLYQKSSNDRSFKKLISAVRFEEMREAGHYPSNEPGEDPIVRREYNMMHRQANPATGRGAAVEPFMGQVKSVDKDKYMEIFNSIKDEEVVPMISGRGQIRELPAYKLGKGDMTLEEFQDREKIRLDNERIRQEEMDEFLASQKKE